MKIALPTQNNNNIDNHFGHCDKFTVYTVNNNKEITTIETVPSPSGCGCKSNIASILADMGVTLLLAGNMGEGAVNVLKNNGIAVIRGCTGDTKQAVLDYLADKLVDSLIVCHEHESACH